MKATVQKAKTVKPVKTSAKQVSNKPTIITSIKIDISDEHKKTITFLIEVHLKISLSWKCIFEIER